MQLNERWGSLSIPKGNSQEFNDKMSADFSDKK
jgi:hypothetical protein